MTICKMRDKFFDVLSKQKNADMMSLDWATRLVNEYEIEKKEKK